MKRNINPCEMRSICRKNGEILIAEYGAVQLLNMVLRKISAAGILPPPCH